MEKMSDVKKLTIDELLNKAIQVDNLILYQQQYQTELLDFLCKVDSLFKKRMIEVGEILRVYPSGNYPSSCWSPNIVYALDQLLDSDHQAILLAKKRVALQEEHDSKEKKLIEENRKEKEILVEAWGNLRQYEKTLTEIRNK